MWGIYISWYVCVCVCVCVHIYICMYIYIHPPRSRKMAAFLAVSWNTSQYEVECRYQICTAVRLQMGKCWACMTSPLTSVLVLACESSWTSSKLTRQCRAPVLGWTASWLILSLVWLIIMSCTLFLYSRNEASLQITQGNGRATGREEVRVIGSQHLCHEEWYVCQSLNSQCEKIRYTCAPARRACIAATSRPCALMLCRGMQPGSLCPLGL